MVDLTVKVMTDPLNIQALIEFIKKYKTVAINYIMTLISEYKHERTLRVK